MIFNLSAVSFIIYVFFVFYLRNLCLPQGHRDFILTFSSGRFMMLDLTFRLMIPFELIFADSANYGSRFTLPSVSHLAVDLVGTGRISV